MSLCPRFYRSIFPTYNVTLQLALPEVKDDRALCFGRVGYAGGREKCGCARLIMDSFAREARKVSDPRDRMPQAGASHIVAQHLALPSILRRVRARRARDGGRARGKI
eukprot:scaffold211631_cov26-Tisochrysis_lutea.AAC.5